MKIGFGSFKEKNFKVYELLKNNGSAHLFDEEFSSFIDYFSRNDIFSKNIKAKISLSDENNIKEILKKYFESRNKVINLLEDDEFDFQDFIIFILKDENFKLFIKEIKFGNYGISGEYANLIFQENVTLSSTSSEKVILYYGNNFEYKKDSVSKELGVILFSGGGDKKIKNNSEQELIIKKVEISGFDQDISDGFSVLFSNITIKELVISDPEISSFELRNCKIDKLIIKNTNLRDSTFNGVEFGEITLLNTTLNECIFNGVLFNKYRLNDDEGKISSKKLQDNYRQLKHVMDKNQNYIEANKFHEMEMEAYMKSIGIEKINLMTLYKENFLGKKSKNLGKRLALTFSYNINEFGNNWIRAIFILILLAIIATILDGISTWIGSVFSETIVERYVAASFFGDIACVVLLIILFYLDHKKNKIIDKINSYYDLILDNIIWFCIVVFIIFSLGYFFNFDSLTVFFNLLDPLYLREEDIKYNFIEIAGFVLYKTLYAIIFWHIITAMKKDMKR